MMLKRGFAVSLGIGLLACSSAQSSGSGGLCPTCAPLVGGESSDFGGGQANCQEQERALSQAEQDEFRVAELVAAAAEPLTTSLRWNVHDPLRADTTLTAITTLGSPTFRAIGVEASDACQDRVLIPATVDVSTADDGFATSLRGAVELRRGDLIWHLRAAVNLASGEGNLALQVDSTRRHAGELALDVRGFPEGRRGSFGAELRYLALGSTWNGPIGEAGTPGVEQVELDLARFPADQCTADSVPIDPDTVNAWFGGASARTLHAQLRAGLPASSTARWLDGSSTQIHVALDQLTDQRVCLAAAFGDPILVFASATRLQSADGRIDSLLPSNQSRLSGTSGLPRTWGASLTAGPLPSAESAEGIQLSAESLAGHDSLRAFFDLGYEWQNDALTGGGFISVDDSGAAERLTCAAWPPGSEYQQRCAP